MIIVQKHSEDDKLKPNKAWFTHYLSGGAIKNQSNND